MFTKSTKYAMRTVIYLSGDNFNNIRLKVDDLSAALNIPKPFLSKILQQLSRNNIVSSSKGRGGGFYLSAENKERPLMDIILCIEGHDVFSKCILGLPNCDDENPCYLHTYYKEFKKDLQRIIKEEPIKNLTKFDEMKKFKL